MTSEPNIRLFEDRDAAAFRDLNVAWIEKYFSMEEKDEQILNDPVGHVLRPGGQIIVAESDGRAVGCVALIPAGQDVVELSKMAVDPSAQRGGIGQAIVMRAIDEARRMNAKKIWLESNTILEAAIRLYRRCGFEDVTGEDLVPSPYSRCNAQMVLTL